MAIWGRAAAFGVALWDMADIFVWRLGMAETTTAATAAVSEQAPIKVRAFEWERDFRDCVRIVYQVWFADCDSKSVGMLSATQFMLHYLVQGTSIFVACDAASDKALGLLVLTNKKHKPLLRQHLLRTVQTWALEKSALCLLYLMPKAKTTRLFSGLFFDNYAKLRKMVPAETLKCPEFLLMIVSPEAQRRGVGRALVHAGETDLRIQGFSRYYLLTDSSCDYQFYERIGMQKDVDVSMSFNIPHVPDYDHYLNYFLHCLVYEQDLNKAEVAAPSPSPSLAPAPATASSEIAPKSEVKAEVKTEVKAETEAKAEEKAEEKAEFELEAEAEPKTAEKSMAAKPKAAAKPKNRAKAAVPAADKSKTEAKSAAKSETEVKVHVRKPRARKSTNA